MLKLNRKDWILGLSIVLVYIAVGLFTLKGYGTGVDSELCFSAGDLYWKYYLGKISLPQISQILGTARFDTPFLYIVEAIPWLLFPVAGGVYIKGGGVWYTESWLISHELLIPVFAGLALLIIYYFTCKVYGKFAAVSATLSLAFLPVFFGEAHLNMKDLPFAALYGLVIILFWKGVSEKDWKWIASSSVIFGLTLASRPMAFTVLFVIYGWLLLTQLHKIHFDKSKLTISLFLLPIIGITVFFLAWPWLWLDPINNLLASARFYQNRQMFALYFGIPLYTNNNLPWHYAIVMLAITTPIPILLFAIVGGIATLKRFWSLRDEASILVLLWFGVSMIRSSLPNIFPVYNGTRLFTDAMLPLCILAGIGASSIYMYLHSHSIKYSNFQHLMKVLSAIIIIGLITMPGFIAIYQIHPYEMSYYNELVGGVKGAYGKFDVDYWSQAWTQGARWLNEHAVRNAKILIPIPTGFQIARYYFTRSDLEISDRTAFEEHVDYVMIEPQWRGYNYVVVYCLNNLKPTHIVSIEGADVLFIYDTTKMDLTGK